MIVSYNFERRNEPQFPGVVCGLRCEYVIIRFL